jgi:hypothetical protein
MIRGRAGGLVGGATNRRSGHIQRIQKLGCVLAVCGIVLVSLAVLLKGWQERIFKLR